MRTKQLLLIASCLVLAPACDDDETTDLAQDSGVADSDIADAAVDGTDPHNGLRLPVCEDTEPSGTQNLPPVASTLVSTVAPMLSHMSTPGPLNPAREDGEAMYAAAGYGTYMHGDGNDFVQRDELTGRGASVPMPTERKSLAWFVHMSDYQLVDDESPNRLALYDNAAIPSGLRAQEAYFAHEGSAFNRTLDDLTEGGREFDFGIITGDCADSGQENELRWFIDMMNGTPGLHLDSGDDDDPVPGPDNDPKDPFDPHAFPAKWLFVPGNHDVMVVGISAPNDAMRASAIGTRSRGARDYTQWYAPVRNGIITADERRRVIDREDIVAMLRADTAGPGPVGHGYGDDDPDYSLGANYVYDAIPGLLRIVSIDSSDLTGGSEGMITRRQLDEFILPAIHQAEADGMLVMLASHHPTTSMDVFPGQISDTPLEDAVPPREIEQTIAAESAVIAWLVGHVHDNRIRAIAGPDAEHPGYWEIMTAAIADWPAQVRTIELVDNNDGTLSIYGTLIDYNEETCFERRARRLTMMEWVSGWMSDVSHDPRDFNVELVVPTPAAAADAVAAARTTAPDRIESETTLRGDD